MELPNPTLVCSLISLIMIAFSLWYFYAYPYSPSRFNNLLGGVGIAVIIALLPTFLL